MLLEIHAFDVMREQRTLIRQLSLQLRRGERVALLGANGSGKSTLLAHIARGAPEVRRAPGIWLTQVPQRLQPEPGVSLRALARRAAASLEALGVELATESAALRSDASEAELQRLGELQSLFEARGGFELDARIDARFERFGLGSVAEGDSVKAAAGALQLAALVGALCSGAELLLLDEPTNHLDLQSRTLLAAQLQRHQGAVLFASHDREFIERLATHTLWIDQGRATLRAGGYQRARSAQQEQVVRSERAERERRKRLRELDDMVATLRSFGHARAQVRRQRAERERDALQRALEPQADAPHMPWQLQAATAGGELARFTHLSAFGLIEEASFTLRRGDKVALVGPSGCGKSTLLELIAGSRASDDPRASSEWRAGVSLHHIDQHRRGLTLASTPLAELGRWVSEGRARSLLALMSIPAQRHQARIDTLSGGEQMRLAVALVMAREPTVLLLDEPTRDLDLPAIEALQSALQQPGLTLLIATHDAALIDALGAEVVSIEAGRLVHWRGGLQGWRQGRRRLEPLSGRESEAAAVSGVAEIEDGAIGAAAREQQLALAEEEAAPPWEAVLLRANEVLSDPLRWGEREVERWQLRRREAEEALLEAFVASDAPPEPPLRTREGGARVWGETTPEGPHGGLRVWFEGAPAGEAVRLALLPSEHGLIAHARVERSELASLTSWGEDALLKASARLALYHHRVVALQVASTRAPAGFRPSSPGWWVRWGRDIEHEERWLRPKA